MLTINKAANGVLKKALFFSCLILFVLGLALLFNKNMMTGIFIHTSFYFVAVLTLIWFVVFIASFKTHLLDLRTLISNNGIPALFILLVCVLIFIFIPPRLRVLADESNLAAMSYSMAKDQRADLITASERINGHFQAVKREVPFRPLLFSFLASVIHLLSGYRIENIFALNGAVLFLTLFTIFAYIRKYCGFYFGIAAVLLVISHPIFTLVATSGSYDLLFGLFMFLSFLSVSNYLRSPGESNFKLMLINLAMLSNVRHECFIFLLLTLFLLFIFKRLPSWHSLGHWFYGLILFLLLPVIWQTMITPSILKQYLPEGAATFSITHFIKQNKMFLANMFRFDRYLPYDNVVFLLSWVAALYFLIKAVCSLKSRGFGDVNNWHLLFITVANLVASWITFMSWFWGNCDSPGAARFYLLFTTVASLVVTFFLADIFKKKPFFPIIAAILCCAVYFPVAIENKFYGRMAPWEEHYFVTRFIEKLLNRDFLLISETPRRYTIYECGSVSYRYANRNIRRILKDLRVKRIGQVFVLQRLPSGQSQSDRGIKIPNTFRLRKLIDIPLGAYNVSRLNQVVSEK